MYKKYFRYWFHVIIAIISLSIINCSSDSSYNDSYEPNDTCTNPRDLGSYVINSPENSWTANISSAGDIDWFLIKYEENEGICGLPNDPQTFSMNIRLIPPQSDCIDLNLYIYNDACNLLASSELTGCLEETISYEIYGICGQNDSNYIKIKIEAASGDLESSVNYNLYFSMQEI